MSSCIFCSGATRRAAPRPESFRGEGPARRRRGDGVTRCRPRRFHDDNHAILYRKIKAADYAFDPQYWDQVSDDAKDLIKKMLVVDPDKRSLAASRRVEAVSRGRSDRCDRNAPHRSARASSGRK